MLVQRVSYVVHMYAHILSRQVHKSFWVHFFIILSVIFRHELLATWGHHRVPGDETVLMRLAYRSHVLHTYTLWHILIRFVPPECGNAEQTVCNSNEKCYIRPQTISAEENQLHELLKNNAKPNKKCKFIWQVCRPSGAFSCKKISVCSCTQFESLDCLLLQLQFSDIKCTLATRRLLQKVEKNLFRAKLYAAFTIC